MDFLANEFTGTIIYALLGLILMLVGYKFIDFIIPCDFVQELREKNPAVGAIIAGVFIAVAIIVKAAIS